MALADQYGLLILAPEFSETAFPRSSYQFGNVLEDHPEQWNFHLIEALFTELRAREGWAQDYYYLFGHSAGAQFVHRFMLFMPHHHVKQAVAANAGTYTMPAYDTPYAAAFPMRIAPDRVPPAQLQQAFRQNLVIMLGERDVNEEAPNLANSAAAKLQGKHRFERGQHFFQTAQTEAARLQTPLNWQLVTVPGVAHNSAAMAKAAADYLFAN
jgi:poly(3-hydroxybutyrate) depolymerase